MITKIVLGNGQELFNVEEVQETIQNEGNYIRRGLTINLTSNEERGIKISDIETLFNIDGVLSSIEVYKKDSLERVLYEETDEWVEVFGDEYLLDTYTEYSGATSIYKHINTGRISIQLIADPSNLEDSKYRELLAKNEEAKNIIADLTELVLMGGI